MTGAAGGEETKRAWVMSKTTLTLRSSVAHRLLSPRLETLWGQIRSLLFPVMSAELSMRCGV